MNPIAMRHVQFAKLWLQAAADMDRASAYAEDAERNARFTAGDIQPGFRYKAWKEDRTIIKVGKVFHAIGPDHCSYTNHASAADFAEFLNSGLDDGPFQKIAP